MTVKREPLYLVVCYHCDAELKLHHMDWTGITCIECNEEIRQSRLRESQVYRPSDDEVCPDCEGNNLSEELNRCWDCEPEL